MSIALRYFLAAAIGLFAFDAGAQTAPMQSNRTVLDDFENVSAWDALASDGVFASVSGADTPTGRGLKLEFDFAGVAGYASAQRLLPLDLPENYEISFLMRADAPVNTLEFKLVDESGDNVWWNRKADFTFPGEWKRIVIKKRHIWFAWGPTKDRTLRHAASLELAVTAGKDGGKGTIFIDDLSIRELPPPPAEWPIPVASATSFSPDGSPEGLFDQDRDHGWRSAADNGKQQSLTVDLGADREFGGLTLRWAKDLHASDYRLSFSSDGEEWETVRQVRDSDGGADPLKLTEAEARYLRFDFSEGPGPVYGLNAIDIQPLHVGENHNQFVEHIAREERRGLHPRGFSEQTYWTIVGVDGGEDSGLMSEDGAIELRKGGIAVEPFVVTDDGIVTWADVETQQTLRDGDLPIPSVSWRHPKFDLRVTAIAHGEPKDAKLYGRYDITNRTTEKQRLTLALALRPFQVNPPTQKLNIIGGVSPIESIGWTGKSVSINGLSGLTPLSSPDEISFSAFDSGRFPQLLKSGPPMVRHEVSDKTGLASGTMLYPVELEPGESATFGFVSSLGSAPEPIAAEDQTPREVLDRAEQASEAEWSRKLDTITIDTPPEGERVVNSIRIALAHILMSRDEAALKPGSRSYDRSWIRDGAMISEALVRLGHANLAADYLRWFAPHQFENGKIPCCVDGRGADPVPENDSQGAFIFLAADVWQYTKDRALLEEVWPRVLAAARYMDELRRSERTSENETPERRMLFGLMPPSISHEGYSEKPAYSYWDNFWSLRGYKDAVTIATVLDKPELGELIASRDEFARDLMASIPLAAKAHGIDYIPGAADLGDFDATSTTIALSPGDEQDNLPPDLLMATFERYWTNFVKRRDENKSWNDYTPYELRNIGAFVQLGWRERAGELMDFFFADQRPAGWLQWAEVVGREARNPRFIGDMPHAWVASDYIRSALNLFVYGRERDQSLVLAAGVPTAWFDREGVSVSGITTPYGVVSYEARPVENGLLVKITGDARPPGGYFFALPWPAEKIAVTAGGVPVEIHGDMIRMEGPGQVLIMRRPPDQPASLDTGKRG